MFGSSLSRLRLPSGWTVQPMSAGNLAEGRYKDLLDHADQLEDSGLWFQLASGTRAFALIGGLTALGKKRVGKDPSRLTTFNQQVLVRTWHVEDSLAAAAGTYVPVASVAVLPYGWVIRDLDPAVIFTSRQYLKKELAALESNHASWRPSIQADWKTIVETVETAAPSVYSLVTAASQVGSESTPPQGSN